MTPYYQSQGITIYHGDCRDVLPELSLSEMVFVTDPFYGIDGGRGSNRKAGKGNYESTFDDNVETVKNICVPVILFLSKNCIRGAVTPGIRCLFNYPAPQAVGCFWSPAAVGNGPWGWNCLHPILYYGKDPRAGKGQTPSGKLLTETSEKNGHPCPKPIKAWTWLVNKVSVEEPVIDPFMGSGTTLRAAKDLGRKAIGIDIEEKYCEIAARRLEQEVFAL